MMEIGSSLFNLWEEREFKVPTNKKYQDVDELVNIGDRVRFTFRKPEGEPATVFSLEGSNDGCISIVLTDSKPNSGWSRHENNSDAFSCHLCYVKFEDRDVLAGVDFNPAALF